jgi:dolichyl-phosphate beta-glucosyltransferase
LPLDLSFIVPVFNGALFIKTSAVKLDDYLSRCQGLTYEIIFVDDGSSDGTAQALQELHIPHCRVIRLEVNQGKFAAIICGMSSASGTCRIFTDADLPYDLDAIPYLINLVTERRLHIVIGDRTLVDSEYNQRLPPLRAVVTSLFTVFVRVLVVSGLSDTQCGLKAFRGDVATHLFPLLQDRGFSGDVELLYIALKYNLEIKRIPVRLRRAGPSTVSVFRDGLQMLYRIAGLRKAWRRGKYHSEALMDISRQCYWEASRDDAN